MQMLQNPSTDGVWNCSFRLQINQMSKHRKARSDKLMSQPANQPTNQSINHSIHKPLTIRQASEPLGIKHRTLEVSAGWSPRVDRFVRLVAHIVVDFNKRSPSNWCPFSLLFWLGGGTPTKIDYRKRLVPLLKPLYWRTQPRGGDTSG